MKRYDIKYDLYGIISATFGITFSYLGTLFAEAWLTDDVAAKILEKFPGSIKIMS